MAGSSKPTRADTRTINKKSHTYVDSTYVRGPDMDDISIEVKGLNFVNAVSIINNLPSKYEAYSLVMFRNVIAPVDIDYEKYVGKLNELARSKQLQPQLVNYERLQEITMGVYYNENIIISQRNNEMLLRRILEEEPENNVGMDDWEICVKAINDLFENGKDGRAYMRDLEVAPDEVGCSLENIESHISLSRNETVQRMPGINTSMHYIGEQGSYTALHKEDGGLSSINILKSGSPKIWLIVDYRWQAELETNFIQYLKSKNYRGNICNQILKHKIYLVTPALLMEWKIPYSIVLQRPGDLFFIRSGTYHAVINAGRNLAEAINYGCDKWNSSYQPGSCTCEESNKSDVNQDRCIIVTHKSLKRKLFLCNEEDCPEVFGTKYKLKIHKNLFHKKKETYECTVCSKIFTYKTNLIRHNKMHSSNDGKKECNLCKKMVVRLSEHKIKVHEKNEECPQCKNKFSKPNIRRHQKSCRTEFMCNICSQACSSNSGLARHMKTHIS